MVPPQAHFARTRYEFRRLWDLIPVRIVAGVFNLGAVAAGVALSWGEDEVFDAVLITVGALALAVLFSAFVVLVIAFAIAPHRILKDRLAELEGELRGGDAVAQQGTVYNIEHVGSMNVIQSGRLEEPSPGVAGTAVESTRREEDGS